MIPGPRRVYVSPIVAALRLSHCSPKESTWYADEIQDSFLHSAQTGTRICRTWSIAGAGCTSSVARARQRLVAIFVTAMLIALGAFWGRPTAALAQEGCTGAACVSPGSTVAEFDSSQSALLDAILSNLTGGSVNLSAGDYNALLDGDVELGVLFNQLQADLNVATPEEVLDAEITLGQLLDATAVAAGDATVEAALNNLALALDMTATIRLGDLLQIESGAGSFADIDLNVLELVVGTIQLFNHEHAVDVSDGITIGGGLLGIDNLAEITLRAAVVEAPVIVCDTAGATFNSAAMRVALHLTLADVEASDTIGIGSLLNLLNVNVAATLTQLDLYLDIGRGQGVIQSVDAVSNAVSIEATPGQVNLYLGHIDEAVFFDRQATITAEDLEYGTIGSVSLTAAGLGLSVVDINAKAAASGGSPDPETLNFTGPYPETQSTATGAGALDNLLTSLVNNLELQVQLADGFELLDGLLSFVLNLIVDLVNDLLSPLLDALLNNVVDPVLDGLGLTLGKMTVTVLGAEALCPSLTVEKSHASDFLAGGVGIYSIVVRNDGSGPTTGTITVVDTLPAELTYTSFTGTGWSFAGQSGQEVSFTHEGPLAPGASLPTLRLQVAVDATASGTVTNQVAVDTPGNEDTGDSADSDDTNIIDLPPDEACEEAGICPSLTVEKSHDGPFMAGEEGEYSILVRNDGANVTTDTIVVTDTLPAGMSFASFGGSGWGLQDQLNGGQVLIFVHDGPIAPGESLPVLTLTVDVEMAASGTLVNSVETGTPGNVGNGDSSTQDPTEITPAPTCPDLPDCPSLRVEKSHSGDFVAGEQGEYVIVVHNDGTAATSGTIVVTDTLPTGMSLSGIDGAGWTLEQQIGRMYIFHHPGPLAADATLAPLVLTVNVSENAQGTLTNRVSADTEGNVATDDQNAEDPTQVVPPPTCPDLDECPSLTVAKSHTGNFVAGGQGVYEIVVTNVGSAATESAIVVTDTLPAGMSYATHSGSGWVQTGNSEGSVLRFIHGSTLQPGAALPTLRLTVDVDAEAAGTRVNSVEVTTQGNVPHDDATSEDPTEVVPADDPEALCQEQQVCPSLAVEKSHAGNFVAGGQGVYSIRVSNDGSAANTGAITVIDTLPTGLAYVAHSGSGWTLSSQSGPSLVFTHSGPLAPGATLPALQITVNIHVDAAGTVVNEVTVDTAGNIDDGDSEAVDPTDIVPPGDPETLCVEHQVCPALQLQKTAVGSFPAGGVGQYRFTVHNIGGGVTYGTIMMTDTLPAGLTYLSHSGEGWSIAEQNGQTLVLSHSNALPPGETLPTLVLFVEVDESLEGQIVNSAQINTPGGIGGADLDDAPADVVPGTTCPESGDCPALVVDKSHAGNFRAGATGVYSIDVRNEGSGTTLGMIVVEDTLPPGMSYVTHSGAGWGLLEDAGETVIFSHAGPTAAGESLPTLLLTVEVSRQAQGTLVNQVSVDTLGNVDTEGQSAEDATTILPLDMFFMPIIEGAMSPEALPTGWKRSGAEE